MEKNHEEDPLIHVDPSSDLDDNQEKITWYVVCRSDIASQKENNEPKEKL